MYFCVIEKEVTIIEKYLREVACYPLLTHEEEISLGKQKDKGDISARDMLVNSNLRFVISVAKKYQGQGLELMDLISTGNVGLITAANRYKHAKGYRFVTYAVWWIRQCIIKEIREKGTIIRLPNNKIEMLRRVEEAVIEMGFELGRDPSNEELAKEFGTTKEVIESLFRAAQTPTSMDKALDESGRTLADIKPDENSNQPFIDVDESMGNGFDEIIGELAEILTEKELDIFCRINGVGKYRGNPQTLKQAGKAHDVGKERARQINERALFKIKKTPSIMQDMEDLHKEGVL